jgi:heterodisulfide reductase subunit A
MAPKVGVYVCHCGINIAHTVDVEEVARFAATLPNVAVARDYIYVCSDPGQQLIQEDIRELGLTRVVVASCSPRMHELTFRSVIQEAGLNPYYLQIANIREQCSWVHSQRESATEKAKALVAAAVARACLLEPLEEREAGVVPAALVIGGGIAGLRAALDIADAGYMVYVVEKEPAIGGHVAQLGRTFPTLDDVEAMVGGLMDRVENHARIELLTNSELLEIEGFIGNFQVKVRRKPRYVDGQRCTACGLCAEACVLKGKIDSEFNVGLEHRSAIHLPFPQAVPGNYVVDTENCLLLQSGQCEAGPPCKEACPEEAVEFGQEETVLELNVGSIIVATGFDVFDASLKPEYGYGVYDNVITGLEFERLSSSSGPTGGQISVNGRVPRDVVFIHCVGSRDRNLGNPYCSRICCMYAAKQAHLVREKLPEARITVFYIDVRAFGKGFEEFYDRVREERVLYRRGNPSEIYKRDDKLVVRAEDTLLGEAIEVEADLIVLATGIVPRRDIGEIANLLKLPSSEDGFFMELHPKLRPVDTTMDGVYLAGCCQGPKDITDTVAQAKAAASSALIPLCMGKVRVESVTCAIDPLLCSGCGLCAELCVYGALALDERRGVMTANQVLCKGCAACATACPSGAIVVKHFTPDQILAEVEVAI